MPHQSPQMSPLLIEDSELRDHDVLLGRTAACAGHVGTIAFKAFIASRLDLYEIAACRRDKTEVTRDVLDSIKLTGSRIFARSCSEKRDKLGQETATSYQPAVEQDLKQSLSVISRSSYLLEVLDDSKARVKIRDALRDCGKSRAKQQQGQASVLLYKMGLSGIFTMTTSCTKILDYVAKSARVREFLRDRNDIIEQRNWRFQNATVISSMALQTPYMAVALLPKQHRRLLLRHH